MHELGLCEGILSVVTEIAGERPVRRVTVRVGALQRVDQDSLRFSFELVSAGTPAESATLELVAVPARLRCLSCAAEGEHEPGVQIVCWKCGASQLRLVQGDEVLVDEVELADEPPTVLRRPGTEVVEPPHEHPQEHEHEHLHEHERLQAQGLEPHAVDAGDPVGASAQMGQATPL